MLKVITQQFNYSCFIFLIYLIYKHGNKMYINILVAI